MIGFVLYVYTMCDTFTRFFRTNRSKVIETELLTEWATDFITWMLMMLSHMVRIEAFEQIGFDQIILQSQSESFCSVCIYMKCVKKIQCLWTNVKDIHRWQLEWLFYISIWWYILWESPLLRLIDFTRSSW